ncbi:hypothetical protein FH608_046230 [Nonomuraea phyllanthi]|uniref:Uncharacterized protein n=1 Tax=Nonomuraea phyllanthi TaxID=2219224 RepID=A0A5C4V5W1_9ACTN|nr:hypothetical protein [Nonomuraea phyllanthi]KAB8186893.1 hypothetical protein FH608_046230 [Nonomuraea phyllanthi]
MAEVKRTRSASLYIRSRPPYQGSMTVWALRDFVRALDAEGVSDKTTVDCHHSHDTRHVVSLSVREATTEEVSEPGDDASGSEHQGDEGQG